MSLAVAPAAGCHVVSGLDGLAPPEPAPLQVAWVEQIGGGSDEWVSALAVDHDGNVFLGGNFVATLDLGGEPLVNVNNSDLFLAKLSQDGEHLWSRSFGDPRAATIRGLAVGKAGDVAFTGRLRETIDIGGPISSNASPHDAVYVARLDALGEVLWTRLMQGVGQQQRPYGIAIAGSNVVVVGEFNGTTRFDHDESSTEITSAGAHDAFILNLHGDGRLKWLRGYGDAEEQRASAVAVDGGDIIVAGTTFGTVTVDGVELPTKGSSDPFIFRVDGSGAFKWGATIGDVERNCHEWCEQALAVDDDHRVFYTGAYTDDLSMGDHTLHGSFGADVWAFMIERYGLARAPQAAWSATFGDDAVQRAHGAVFHAGRRPLVVGTFGGTIDFGGGPLRNEDGARDVFVAGFDAQGGHWLSFALPIESDVDRALPPMIAVLPSGDLIVAGTFSGTIQIGDHRLSTMSNDRDIFVARLTGSALARP